MTMLATFTGMSGNTPHLYLLPSHQLLVAELLQSPQLLLASHEIYPMGGSHMSTKVINQESFKGVYYDWIMLTRLVEML